VSLKSLKTRAAAKARNSEAPVWVSETNATYRIYEAIKELELSKRVFIDEHSVASDYKNKRAYQISVVDISHQTGLSSTTIAHTSKYSKDVALYLKDVNDSLNEEKNERLEKTKRIQQSSTRQRKKEQLIIEVRALREKIVTIQSKNAIEQAEYVLSNLPLPIRRHLGLDV
jgi:hypothetical protein